MQEIFKYQKIAKFFLVHRGLYYSTTIVLPFCPLEIPTTTYVTSSLQALVILCVCFIDVNTASPFSNSSGVIWMFFIPYKLFLYMKLVNVIGYNNNYVHHVY